MKLPNLSYMMRVGRLRYIQSVYERGEYRNPDLLIRDFLPALVRWGCDFRGWASLDKLRSEPFYRYVIARTKYYDAVFVDGIVTGVDHIVNIGCGSDTRAYRFAHILKQKGIRVLECDQAAAISAKQKIVATLWPNDHVDYMALDLNEPGLPSFTAWLTERRGQKLLVMLEGVSPYVNEGAFGYFLRLLASALPADCQLAYDYKLPDVAAGFGLSEHTTQPFRMSGSREQVAHYHLTHGLILTKMEASADLTSRLVPDSSVSATPLFAEDVLIQLSVR